jgi:hypothetical protein
MILIAKIAIALMLSFTPTSGVGLTGSDSLSFGPVRLNGVVADTVRLHNAGLQDLFVDGRIVSPSAFSILGVPFSGAPLRLPPSEVLEFVVEFSPTQLGEFSSTAEIRTDESVLSIPLSGAGVKEVVVINEILADPPAGEAGDANGDGIRNSNKDEFVELLNIGRYAVDLTGVQLFDAGSSSKNRFTFPDGTWLGPSAHLVLFGGGAPPPSNGQIYVDDGKIGGGLRNSGDDLFLINPENGDTLASASYGAEGGKNQSLVRFPEGTGEFTLHSQFPGNGAAFSPGSPREILTRIEISPGDTTISIGEEVSFTAVGLFPGGDSMVLSDEVAWVSSNAGIFELSGATGTGRGVGRSTVTAIAGGVVSQETEVEVSAPGIGELKIVPVDTFALVGDDPSFQALGVYEDGTEVSIDAGLNWTTTDTTVVVLGEHGDVRLMTPGSATIMASWEELFAEALVTVLAWGDLNGDGALDVLDAVRTVHLIIGREPSATRLEERSSDLNRDGDTDILDLSLLIGRILGRPIESAKPIQVAKAFWRQEMDVLVLQTSSSISALFLELDGANVLITVSGDGLLEIEQESGPEFEAVVVYSLAREGIRPINGEVRLSIKASEMNSGNTKVRSVEGVDLLGSKIVFHNVHAESFGFRLAHPNPFNASTVIEYDLQEDIHVLLRVFTPLGQEVARLVEGSMMAGRHQITWRGQGRQGEDLASGVYLACIEAGSRRSVGKLLLLK